MAISSFSTENVFITETVSFISSFITDHSAAIIGLSGGSTPGHIYTGLSQQDLDFSKVRFFQVDERYVPSTNLDSNHKLITETLLSTQKIPKQNFHYFDTTFPIDECLNKYEQNIKNLLNLPPKAKSNREAEPSLLPSAYSPQPIPFLTILGIGPDGHTASLFPNSPALHETERLVAHTTTDHFATHDRLTITFPLIMASEAILVLVKGKDKKKILDTLLNSDQSIESCPAKRLLKHSNLNIYFGDF